MPSTDGERLRLARVSALRAAGDAGTFNDEFQATALLQAADRGQPVSPPLRVSRVGSGVPGPFAGRAPSRARGGLGRPVRWLRRGPSSASPAAGLARGACYACCWPRTTRTPFARSLTGADYTTGARVDGVTDGDE